MFSSSSSSWSGLSDAGCLRSALRVALMPAS